MDLYTLRLFKWCRTWSSSTKSKSSLLHTFPLTSEAWCSWRLVLPAKTEGNQYLGLSCILCHQGPYPIQQQAHVFPSPSFAADVQVEAFLVPHQIQPQVGFGFPEPIPAYLDSVYIPPPSASCVLPFYIGIYSGASHSSTKPFCCLCFMVAWQPLEYKVCLATQTQRI